VSSENVVPVPPASASDGRSVVYRASPTGASTDSESTPPGRKTLTSTGCPDAPEACATPASSWSSPSLDAP
jgi:hypothetical protein